MWPFYAIRIRFSRFFTCIYPPSFFRISCQTPQTLQKHPLSLSLSLSLSWSETVLPLFTMSLSFWSYHFDKPFFQIISLVWKAESKGTSLPIMGKDYWYWGGRSSKRGGGAERETEITSRGCMCAVLQAFDFHPFHFSINQQQQPSYSYKTPSSISQDLQSVPKGIFSLHYTIVYISTSL